MMGFKIENNNTCRVCLKTKNTGIFSIYEKMSEEYTEPIFSMIIYCASVNISREDGLPDVVCESCKTRLETSYLFKRDCEQSDAKLRMKIEIDYNFKQENNNDSENCIETINTENIKLENDTNLHNYENNEESLDTVYPNMFATAEIHDSKIPIEASTIASENVFVGNSDNHGTDKEDNETDTEYRPKKLNRKRKKKAINLARLRKLICYVCIKTFPTQNDYNAHIAQHPNQKYSCDQENCNMEFSNYIKYAIHRKNIHLIEHYLTCKDCQKSFNNKKSFDRHVLNLHGDRPYGCLKCSKTFREESALTNHVEKTHSKEYKCEFCEKVFSTSFRLSTHRRLHTQEKPYICQDCGKSWIDKSSLTKHIDAHHSDKPKKKREKNHLCSYCGQAYNRLDLLTKHIRRHTGSKPFSCDHCDYRSRDQQSLRSHIRTHTGDRPYKCSYCEKSFSTRGYLTIHERFHSGHRPYICSSCKKGFTNSKDLKVHERTHTGIKLFTCDICNNSFTTLHYLRVHTKKHDT